MSSKTEKLTKELLELLKKGNITLEETVKNPSILLTHPDFDKAIDILAQLDEEVKGESS